MMKRNSNQKLIAVTVLLSIILTLFLSCHFHIWSGIYCVNDLESITVEQELLIAQAHPDNDAPHTADLYLPAYFVPAESGIFPVFISIFIITFSVFEFRQHTTLCSLSVRMDN